MSPRSSQLRTKTSQSSFTTSRRLSLKGYRVTQICINLSFVEILLADSQSSIALGISAPFTLKQNSRTQTLDLREPKGLAPLLVLLDKEADFLEVFRDGSLKLVMASKSILGVSKEGPSDAWFASGTEALTELEDSAEEPKKRRRARPERK